MFIQYYVSQCCKIAMFTVNRGGVYIDDSFTVTSCPFIYIYIQNLVTLIHTTHTNMFSEFSSQWKWILWHDHSSCAHKILPSWFMWSVVWLLKWVCALSEPLYIYIVHNKDLLISINEAHHPVLFNWRLILLFVVIARNSNLKQIIYILCEPICWEKNRQHPSLITADTKLDSIICTSPNISTVIKSKRMRLMGRAAFIGGDENV